MPPRMKSRRLQSCAWLSPTLGRLRIDRRTETGRLLDQQFSGSGTQQQTIDMASGLAEELDIVGTVGTQAGLLGQFTAW